MSGRPPSSSSSTPCRDGLTTAVGHGGDPSGSAAALPGEEAEGLLMQPDPLGPRLPAGDLVDHRHPGAAAVPGVRSGDGSSWVGHGRSASMEK